ncbi:MAG TPA: glycosyltransferase family 87 protein [Gaiellaceae bacterium]|nr:glycosyltransferase family 87 protein [Gaiellaceae bacterium]
MRANREAPALGWWRVLFTGVLVGAATILVMGILLAVRFGNPGWDSRFAYLQAAESVLEGKSPYPRVDDPILEEDKGYVYPPQLAFVFVPLTALPVDAAAAIAIVTSLAAVLAALAVVGARDVRCYAAVLLWAPAWNAIENANVSAALTLGVALVWRFRATLWPLATALGLAVSTKLFLWPLLVWAVATRRLRATSLAVAIGLGVTLAAWAVIDFRGLTGYLALVSKLSEIQAEHSYSFVGMTAALGFGPTVGQVLMLTVGGALLAACFNLGRHGDERRAFTCAIVACLVLTPIVWQHYLSLLVVPLALARPRFSAIWLLPVVLWLSPRLDNGHGLQPFLPALVVLLLVSLLLARPRVANVVAEAA